MEYVEAALAADQTVLEVFAATFQGVAVQTRQYTRHEAGLTCLAIHAGRLPGTHRTRIYRLQKIILLRSV